MKISGRLEICGDPAGRQHVQQMFTDTRVNVSDHRVFLRYQAVVAPAAPRPTPWHRLPLPAADTATVGPAAKKTADRNPDTRSGASGSALWCAELVRRLFATVITDCRQILEG